MTFASEMSRFPIGVATVKIITVMLAAITFSVVAAQAAAEDNPLKLFKYFCLETAIQPARIAERVSMHSEWEAAPPKSLSSALKESQAWILAGRVEKGHVSSGYAPLTKTTDLRLCTLSMPKGALTLDDAVSYLKSAGGLLAHPWGKHNAASPVLAFQVKGDHVYLGAQLLADQTTLQLLAMDGIDDEVKAAIEFARQAN